MKEKSVAEKRAYFVKRVLSGGQLEDDMSEEEQAYRNGYVAGLERGYDAGRREAVLELRRNGWKPKRTS